MSVQPAEWTLWDWPFFEQRHLVLAEKVRLWNRDMAAADHGGDLPGRCRAAVLSLGDAGLLEYVVPEQGNPFDVRALCIIREALSFDDCLVDSNFTMQGIGTFAIQQFGTAAQKDRYLDGCRRGTSVAAFALTEPEAGSDVASMTTTAVRDGGDYIINGEKTLITNAGFADHYVVIARTGEAEGAAGLSAFIVDAGNPGIHFGAPIQFIAEHAGAGLRLEDCRVSADALIGTLGQGFKVAMGAFDIFRPSVGAAAVGLARRAMREALHRVTSRRLFGKPMAALQSVQMTLADMAADIDTAALAVYRAAWERDVRGQSSPYGPSMAKLVGGEAAGRVVDRAVQLSGGAGVTQGNLIEKLYREARPMRIYEGASEVQKLVIGRNILKSYALSGQHCPAL